MEGFFAGIGDPNLHDREAVHNSQRAIPQYKKGQVMNDTIIAAVITGFVSIVGGWVVGYYGMRQTVFSKELEHDSESDRLEMDSAKMTFEQLQEVIKTIEEQNEKHLQQIFSNHKKEIELINLKHSIIVSSYESRIADLEAKVKELEKIK